MTIETIGLSVDPRPAESGLGRVRNSLSLTDRAGRNTQSVLGGIGAAAQKGASVASRALGGVASSLTSLRGIAAQIGLAALAKSVIGAADSYQLLQGRLRLVTTGAENLRSVQESLFQIAQDTRSPIQELTGLYTRLAQSTQQLGATQSQILDLSRAVSESFQISGASASEAAAGIQQFGQALQSGVLQGDELRSIAENAPRLFSAIITGIQQVDPALNVTRANFRALAADGQITASLITRALLSQKDIIEREFAQVPRTVGQAFTQLQNEIFRSVGTADTSPLIRAIDELREKVKDPTFQQGLVDTATGIAKIVALLARVGGAAATGITNSLDALAERAKSGEIRNLELQIEGLQDKIAKFEGPGRFILQAFGRDTQTAIAAMNAELAEAQNRLATLRGSGGAPGPVRPPLLPGAGSDTSNIRGGGGGTEKAAKQRQTEAERLIESLTQELALYGELTKAEEVRISLANGFYGKVTPAQASHIQALADEITRRDQLTDSIKAEIEAEAERIAKMQELKEEGKAVFEATRTPLERYNAELDRLGELLRAGAIDQETFARGSKQAGDELKRLAEKTDETTKQMQAFADQAARNIQDIFADFLFDPFDKGLKGMLLSFEETIRRMVAQQAAAQILGGFSGMFGGSGGGGGDLFGTLIGFGASLFGGGVSPTGTVTSFPGRAIGGDVFPGQAYTVGEMGRERFVPAVRGKVEAANDPQPVYVTNHFNISAPNGSVSRQSQAEVAAAAGQGVQRALRRNR